MSEEAAPFHALDVVWQGGRRYRGERDGTSLVVDGDRRDAPSPVDALVTAIASCSAIDVVDILEKRRTPADSLRVHADFRRAPNPPKRLTEVRLRFTVGTASERGHVERAVELSLQKYCSVSNSLAPDVRITWEVDLQPVGSAV